MDQNSDRPCSNELYYGAIFESIGHAVYLCHAPDMAAMHSWDGTNYSVQDFEGSRGTLSFGIEGLVGAFFDTESSRNPFRSGRLIDPMALLEGAPESIRRLAQREAFQYLCQEFDGSVKQIVTAAFWSVDPEEPVSSVDSWDQCLTHGASLVCNEMFNFPISEGTLPHLDALTSDEVALVVHLFSKRTSQPTGILTLNDAQVELLRSRAISEEAWAECCESLNEIGISIP